MSDCRTCLSLDCTKPDDYDIYSLQQPSIIAAAQSGRITLSTISIEPCVGDTVDFNVTASGPSVDGYSEWSVLGGSLPAGLTLKSNGSYSTISGTPTTTGLYIFSLLVESTNGDRGAKVYELLVTGCVCNSYSDSGGAGSGFVQLLDPIVGTSGDYIRITLTLTGSVGAFLEIDGGPFYRSAQSEINNTVSMEMFLGPDGGSGYYIGFSAFDGVGAFSGYSVEWEVCTT